MPRIYKQLRAVGVYISFSPRPCQLVPAVYRQESNGTTFCQPGIPYEVLLEHIEPEWTDQDGIKTTETLWLGLRPLQASQNELDWVRISEQSGDITGIYCRLNQQYSDVEET